MDPVLDVGATVEAARDMMISRCSITELEAQFQRDGVRTLLDDGLDKAKSGITTLEELTRVLG